MANLKDTAEALSILSMSSFKPLKQACKSAFDQEREKAKAVDRTPKTHLGIVQTKVIGGNGRVIIHEGEVLTRDQHAKRIGDLT